ncbi:LytR/AlgR family response regulator transcription factor [Williamsia muralis]|uniref:LytR/AlgR family response regulator transcription factor n=1 Tax=Williamsia marianensis TaxID=85044 RepID=UPI000DE6837C|nr:LytTR family DNA-binding domain-containing protein [Williamsia marianensis]PVY30589.1 LytTR family two component transcriptional regulator [Williamsia marianensis]
MTQTPNSSGRPGRHALTVLAVDDEWPALDELSYLLRAQEAVGEVLTAGDATTALRLIKDRPGAIDAVFLDINMPGLDGLELAGVLAAFAHPPAVVFVTAHEDRAVRAFDLGAVDYLLKPLRAQRLAESVRRVLEHREQRGPSTPAASRQDSAADGDTDEVIPVEMGGTTTLVPRSTVNWVEADGDYTRLHTATGSHLVRIPISTLEERWRDAGFLRVHRSYLVALPLVTGIRTVGSGTVVCLRSVRDGRPVELPVSRRHTRELKDRLVRIPRQTRNAP